jgi:tetrapyrrole methylase family protein/MazG family protein
LIHLIGLGTGRIDQISLGAWEALRAAPRVLARTEEHPAVPELRARGVRVETLLPPLGEDADAFLAARVLAAEGDVAYAVPGHPLIGDRSVFLVREEAARRGMETRVHPAPSSAAHAFQEFAEVIARLRGPDGCPWDREQTYVSLKRFMIEEAYEAVEAVDSGRLETLCDELGDVLIQVVLNAQLAAEEGTFTITDVIEGVTAKLIRRHPHVFGDVTVADSAEVLRNWEAIKRTEKPERTSILDGVPRDLPALMKAMEVSKRAVKVGFEWPSLGEVFAKLHEEIAELQAALPAADPEAIAGEIGDLLFTTVNIARFLKVDPEDALRTMVARFSDRFRHMEQAAAREGRPLTALSLEEWDRLWEAAKAKVT